MLTWDFWFIAPIAPRLLEDLKTGEGDFFTGLISSSLALILKWVNLEIWIPLEDSGLT